MPKTTARPQVSMGAILLLMCGVLALFSGNRADGAQAAELVRVTTSFDVKYAPVVLRLVARLPSGGLGKGELEKVTREIDSLRADQPRSWQFTVQFQGHPQPLEIHALLDDLGMIDLDFATTPALAPAIRAAVDGYLNGRGH